MSMSIEAQLYKRAKRNAESRQIEFSLTAPEFGSLSRERCHYCGAKASNKFQYGKGVLVYSGLDRLDPKGGYTIKNVVPCCRFCNTLKSSMPPGTWFDFLCGVIGKHQISPPAWWFDYADPDRPRKTAVPGKIGRR